MSQALYRKYRPQEFKEVKGQDHIVDVLSQGLAKGAIGHAYLFAGTRGTGKTSVARIMARALGTTDRDLYELDAASNRGIDDVRALREAVHTMPFESTYKVYIIDEVHMLTKEAFNALLKTLEEPPAHVIFILATTELDKLPETIISRCEVHTFKSPTRKTLRDHMVNIAKEEGRTLDAGAADIIALVAGGSFRDAHGVLQKIMTATDEKKISADDAARITGAPALSLVNDVVTGIAEGTPETALGAISTAAQNGVSMKLFSELILQRLRAVLMLRFAPASKADIAEEYTAEDVELLEKLAKDTKSPINSALLLRFLDASAQIDRSALPSLPLELAVVDSVKSAA
jgi:DNA polymerase-3 subunit gamma/tau